MSFNLDIIIYICSIITSIAAAAAIINKVVSKTIKKVTKETVQKYMENYDKSVTEQILALTKALNDHIDSSSSSNKTIKDTLLAMSRIQINQIYNIYSDKDYIGSYTLASLEGLYLAYKTLGGNSFVETEMKYLRSLKVITVD